MESDDFNRSTNRIKTKNFHCFFSWNMIHSFLIACYVTLHPAMLVCWSIGWSPFQLPTRNSIRGFVCPLVCPSVHPSVCFIRRSNHGDQVEKCENVHLWCFSYDCLCVWLSMGWGRVWIEVVWPCPPICNDIVTLRHLILFPRKWAFLAHCNCQNAWVIFFYQCPYPPACDWGSRVSGLVLCEVWLTWAG